MIHGKQAARYILANKVVCWAIRGRVNQPATTAYENVRILVKTSCSL
jgi:hypothetical protein